MRPVSPRFIACERPLSDSRIVIYGIPFEGRVNLRKGADTGPLDLRLASDSIETYSPWAQRDLEDLARFAAGHREYIDLRRLRTAFLLDGARERESPAVGRPPW